MEEKSTTDGGPAFPDAMMPGLSTLEGDVAAAYQYAELMLQHGAQK